MKKIKELLSLALTGVFVFGATLPALASEKTTPKFANNCSEISIYSEEFPDAYIVTTTNNNKKTNSLSRTSNTTDLGTITATVFVEENYDLVDGKLEVTDSRLLSKKEVESIGEKNFENLNQKVSPAAATNQKGKLTITFSGNTSPSGNGIICNLSGIAKWDGFNFIVDSEKNPSAGSDYCGFVWSGGFTASNSTASAVLDNGGKQNVYLSESTPNAGRVWSFDEYYAINSYKYYVKTATFGTKLTKSKLEGNGNKAEAVMKYIHTYQNKTGSISISASPSGVGAGFSLSNTSNQWSITATVTGIPY